MDLIELDDVCEYPLALAQLQSLYSHLSVSDMLPGTGGYREGAFLADCAINDLCLQRVKHQVLYQCILKMYSEIYT